MSGLSTSVLGALLKPNVEPGLFDLLYRETDFLNLLRMAGRVAEGTGPSPFQWNVVTSSNSSVEVFTEGQAPPAAQAQSYVQASLAAFYVRGVFGGTGHQRDNERKGGYWTQPSIAEAQLAQSDVFKKLEDNLVGSTQDRGIAGIVSSTGTYANLSQGTYSVWASQNDSSIGTLGVSNLSTLYTEMVSPSQSGVARGATPTHWLMPANQVQNYVATVGPLAASGSLMRFDTSTTDLGMPGVALQGQGNPFTGLQYQGLPIVRVRGITTTEVYLIDITDWNLLIHRDLQVDPIVGNPELDQYQVSFAVAIKCHRRNKHGKLTGVTA